jgi:HPt (histidine-containing phosphotransfer) domain-containing protein
MTPESPIELADFDALLELLDRGTMREVVTLFAISAPERITVARLGIASGEARVVATAFHTMRSGCGQLGARYLEELCANAERSARAGDLAGAAALLDLAAIELERCLGWFREHRWVDS